MATRTVSEVASELWANTPTLLRESELWLLILRGLARLLAASEVRTSEWLAQAFKSTASGAYLDAHGVEMRVPRWPGESDEDYRARLHLAARRVAPDLIREACNALAARYAGEGWTVALVEPRLIGAGEVYADDLTSLTLPESGAPADLFWIQLPVWPVISDTGAYADLCYSEIDAAQDAPTLDARRYLNGEILAYLDDARAAGVGFGVSVDDLVTVDTFGLFYDVFLGILAE